MTVSNTKIRTGNYDTYTNISGEEQKEAVLFLHGSGPGVTAWSNWQFALPALDGQFHAIAPDLAGFGATDHPKDSPVGMRAWMRLWVDQCLALMDAMNIEKAHVVGNSMGGAIALHLLMDAPDRFDRIVHMGPIGTPHKITPALDRLWGFYDDPSVQMFKNIIRWFVYDDSFLADRLDSIAQTRFEAAMNPDVQRSFKAMFPAPRQTAIDDLVVSELSLRRMDHPTLLVHGRDDHIVPLETSLYLLEHLPNVQLHVFGQCSHWIQVERASNFNQLLAQFFTGRI
ncbi:MAG TPA: alpha/beta hydrolase [Anaerolineales bacterium]|nr:alpha/beta hydrolase [Anaerolineales bacterium]